MRTNLAQRPYLKNGSTEWFGPGDWARITVGVHASLPRTIAYAGTTTGDIQPNRGDAIAGKWYVWSLSCRFVSPNTVITKTNWYASGNVYISTTDGQVYDQAGSTTRRVVSGVGQAPPLAVSVRPVLDGIDGSMQVTAVLIEEYDTEAEANAALAAHATAAHYFDGDGDGVGNTGAAFDWTGTDGESPSTSTAGTPASGSVTFGAMTLSALGKRRRHGTASVSFGPMLIATGLLATAVYDDQRGRIRVDALNMATSVVRVIVDARPLGTSRWRTVRGGKVSASGQRFARPVDDYEYTSGAVMQYRITALSSPENSPDVVVHSKILTVDDIPEAVWVKFIAAPYLNRRVLLTDWGPLRRKHRNAVFEVKGRPDPIGVTDVHGSRVQEVKLATRTIADYEGLDSALASGAPVFFQTPLGLACPSRYATVDDFEARTANRHGVTHEFTVGLTEVAAPPPSIVGAGLTWAVLRARGLSWAELTDTYDSWKELQS
jgi:hypothetical protein